MKKIEMNNVGCFVIPNSASTIKYFFSDYQNTLKDIVRLNKLGVNPEEEQYVQCWFYCEDSDNIEAHGVSVGNEFYRPKCGHIPLSMIQNVKEGDEFTVIIPAYKRDEQVAEFIINAKATQQGYRYARFGKFEEVVRQVCA